MTDSNFCHYLTARGNPAVTEFFRKISVRYDKSRMLHCLGTGYVISKKALAALLALPAIPQCYLEIFNPTVLHHLGFGVINIDAFSSQYKFVDDIPHISGETLRRVLREGYPCCHPFKAADQYQATADWIRQEHHLNPTAPSLNQINVA